MQEATSGHILIPYLGKVKQESYPSDYQFYQALQKLPHCISGNLKNTGMCLHTKSMLVLM